MCSGSRAICGLEVLRGEEPGLKALSLTGSIQGPEGPCSLRMLIEMGSWLAGGVRGFPPMPRWNYVMDGAPGHRPLLLPVHICKSRSFATLTPQTAPQTTTCLWGPLFACVAQDDTRCLLGRISEFIPGGILLRGCLGRRGIRRGCPTGGGFCR
jgi:hypothetical protein